MKKTTKLLLLQFGFVAAVLISFSIAIALSQVPIPPRDMILPGVLCVLIYAYLNEKTVEAIQNRFDGVEAQ